MVSGYLKKLATPFVPYVIKNTRKFNLDPGLVMAVIHTESCFNPDAKSHAGAIGLMQLVADKGGVVAYAFIYGKIKIPLPGYLFDPEKNIELGCGYLYLLQNRYFKGVYNKKSRLFCSVSAYNTGPGNVAKAFTGKVNVKNAVFIINSKNNERDVYVYRISHLPYKEKRLYLQKVTKRMDLYSMP